MKIIDNLTDEQFVVAFRNWLDTQTLLYGWKAKKGSKGSFWHKNFVLVDKYKNHYDKDPLASQLTFEKLIKESTPVASLASYVSKNFFGGKELTRVWVNVQSFGDEAAIHYDFPLEYRGKAQTLVWYPVLEWDPEWGGDVAVFDDNKEVTHAAVIKPDRAIIFDGTLNHAARPMSRYCEQLRVSVAFGLEDIT